jgi:SAM-dependent methyltransferase
MNETPDFAAATQVQQQTWSKGDFAMVANIVYNASESLAEALDIIPDERVLDVACGSGNGAIAAARLEIEFVEADAQDLPFEDASFDVAMSIFGAMFAPNQEKAAAELLRVVKPGGRIGMANWTPDGSVGKMFRTISKHAPPPPGLDSPLLWGTEERLRELFGDGIADLRTERRISRQPFRSANHYIEFFRTYFGPTQMAYERVGAEGEQALTDDLRALLEAESTAGERAMVLEAEYLQAIATTRAG